MDDSLIYRKTRRGATELAATHGALSHAARRVLILLDGQRSLAELADLFGSESVEHIIADLEAQGFARQVDPDDAGATTQLVPTMIGDLRPAHYDPPPATRRGSGWIALGLFLAAMVIATGYWLVWRPNHIGGAAIAAARPSEADSAAASVGSDVRSSSEQGDSQSTVRELPLSGLPAVNVTPKAAAARASAETGAPETAVSQEDAGAIVPASASAIVPTEAAAEAPAQNRRSAERSPAKSAPPSEGGSSAASSPSPAARTVSGPVASAANARLEQTAMDAPAGEAIASAASPTSEREPSAAGAPTTASAPPASAAPANTRAEQIAAVAPPARPQSGPVQLHPRKHEPPAYPGRALRSKILEGRVLARVWVTAEGSVEQVDIVKATPPKVFDDEVKRALSAWTFDPPGRPVDTTVELNFKQ